MPQSREGHKSLLIHTILSNSNFFPGTDLMNKRVEEWPPALKELSQKCLCISFLRAAVTNHCELGSLKQYILPQLGG